MCMDGWWERMKNDGIAEKIREMMDGWRERLRPERNLVGKYGDRQDG